MYCEGNKKEKGITLIALVVTIIVLLIFAGVSIMMLTGQNGIIGKANQARTITPQKEAEEAIKLVLGEWKIEKYTGTMTLKEFLESKVPNELDSVTGEEAPFEVEKNGYVFKVNDDGTVKLKDGISLNKSRLTLQIIDGNAESETLIATLNNIEGEVTWTSSNTSVVTVSDGVVTTVGAGETTIKAMCAGKEATCIVTVKEVTSISSIILNPTTGEVDEGSTVEITATVNTGATEDLVWTSSDNSIATVKPSESDSKIGVVKGITPGGPVTITASNTSGSVTATYTLTQVKEVVPEIGDYVNYGVSYTDVYYDSYNYTAQNGWRLLSKRDNDTNANLYDIELISTGIPAGLYYYAYTTNDTWWGNDVQRTEYTNKFYGINSYTNVYAATGLYYNFASIIFNKGSNTSIENNGYYKKINGVESGDIAGSIFKDINLGVKVTGVREVTSADISGNDKATSINSISTSIDKASGLFRLKDLSSSKYATDHGVSTFEYSKGFYYLASPLCEGNNSCMYAVQYEGTITTGNGDVYRGGMFSLGLRPVVLISGVTLTNNNGVWMVE